MIKLIEIFFFLLLLHLTTTINLYLQPTYAGYTLNFNIVREIDHFISGFEVFFLLFLFDFLYLFFLDGGEVYAAR